MSAGRTSGRSSFSKLYLTLMAALRSEHRYRADRGPAAEGCGAPPCSCSTTRESDRIFASASRREGVTARRAKFSSAVFLARCHTEPALRALRLTLRSCRCDRKALGRGTVWHCRHGAYASRLESEAWDGGRHEDLTRRCSEPRASLRLTVRVFAIHALAPSSGCSGLAVADLVSR